MACRYRSTMFVAMACLVVTACLAAAGLPAAGQPVIDGYHDFDGLRIELERIAGSNLATLSSLGQTLGGRDVFLLTLSSGEADAKPALLVVGNVSAPHLAGSELAVRMAKSLVDREAADERVKRLLATQSVYVIPRPSPDASEAFFHKPYFERSGNVRATDDDRDGESGEDPPEDLNGDGVITQIRVEHPDGRYLPHPDEPRVLIKADPTKDERGRYQVFPEGTDNDGDMAWGEDGPGGVDFNRNFTFRYPYFQRGAGPHQVSEPESRAVADFCYTHPNIYAVLTFTPHENLAKPWKHDPKSEKSKIKTAVLEDDACYYRVLGEKYRDIMGGHDPPEPPNDRGSFVHWVYFHFGRWSFGVRGWWIPKVEGLTGEEAEKATGDRNAETGEEPPPATEKPGAAVEQAGGSREEAEEETPTRSEDNRGVAERNALRWFDREQIDGFVPWTPIEHPDFPGRKVEVGGFRPFLRLNPPADQLAPLAEQHAEFLVASAELRPKLAIDVVAVESLSEGAFRVEVAIRNEGFLPTMSAMGEASRRHVHLQAEIKLPDGARLITGSPRVRLGRLAGAGGHVQREWLVLLPTDPASRRVRVMAGSPTTGTVETTIELP